MRFLKLIKTKTIPKTVFKENSNYYYIFSNIVDSLESKAQYPDWKKLELEIQRLDQREVSSSNLAKKICYGNVFHKRVKQFPILELFIQQMLQLFLETTEFKAICKRLEVFPRKAIKRFGAKRIGSWLSLWAYYNYPELSCLLLPEKQKEIFSNYKDIPFQNFIDYLPPFVLYKIRAYLKYCEHGLYTETYLHIWLGELARGMSLRKLPNLHFTISRREAHYMSQAPLGESFDSAYFYGKIKTLGGNIRTFNCLKYYRSSFYDIPEFEIPFFQLVIEAQKEVSRMDVDRCMGYLRHCKRENINLSLKKRTFASLHRQAEAWYREIEAERARVLASQYSDLPKSWTPLPIDNFIKSNKKERFEIIQLTNHSSLIEEGVALRHCVASYYRKCAEKRASIWSLRHFIPDKEDKNKPDKMIRLITIELNATKAIIQARGAFNRVPDEKEKRLILEWVEKAGLTINRY